jgi:hypothetical protein
MPRKAKDQTRSAAQLRRMMRNWRQRAQWGMGLALVSAAGVVASWRFEARGFWWFLSITALVSALIGVFADINAYPDTKKRVAEIERDLERFAA